MDASEEPRAIRPSRAMIRYAIPRDRLYRAINSGELPAINVSLPSARRKSYLLMIDDIERWLSSLKVRPKAN